jgi:hypothetical protein
MRGTVRATVFVGLSACVVASVTACRQTEVLPALIVETGCITAVGDEFVLTDLEGTARRSSEPGPVTEAYVLTGTLDELKPQVGYRVRVTGEAPPPNVVEYRLFQPMVRARQTEEASAENLDPKVGLAHQLRIEVRRLLVRAVNPTGEECMAM